MDGVNWLTGWSHRVKITIDPSEVSGTLTDFVTAVNLGDLPAGFHTAVKTNGADIRVTKSDGDTEVARDVSFYDSANDEGALYFLADSVSPSVDTSFYIYYGNAGASDYAVGATLGRNAVWADYEIVTPLDTVPTASLVDHTGNGNNGASIGGMVAGDLVDAPVGRGLQLDGTDQGVNFGDVGAMRLNDLTLVIVFKFEAGSGRSLIAKSFYSGSNGRYAFLLEENATGNGGAVLLDVGPNYNSTPSGNAYNDPGVWHVAHIIYDRDGNSTLYLDGVFNVSRVISAGSAFDLNAGQNLYLGQYNNEAGSGVKTGQNLEFKGVLSNFRHRYSTMTAAEVAADAVNLLTPSSFYTVGSQEVGSTDTDAERDAEVTGSLSSNAERDAFIDGVDTDQASRGAVIDGQLSDLSQRDALTHGQLSDDNDRSAEISGRLDSDAERDGEIDGIDTDMDTRSALIDGTDISESERDAEISGSDKDISERGALIDGIASSDSDERDAEVSGSDTYQASRDGDISGYDTAEAERNALIDGTDLAEAERDGEIYGVDISNDTRDAEVSGILQASNERDALIDGVAVNAGERSAQIQGVDTDTAERGALIDGVTAPVLTAIQSGVNADLEWSYTI